MATVGAHFRHRAHFAPTWPTWMLGAMATLGVLSIAQGFVDVVLPALTGGEPFSFLFSWTERLGYGFFGAYLFVHNFGLACVVPGFGFLASRYEAHVTNRERIGIILLAAVLVSLLVGLEYLIQASYRFDLGFAIPLFAIEAAAVLLLAWPSARQLKGFVPTPAYGWALVTPFRKLRIPLLVCAAILIVASYVETAIIFDL